MNGIPTYEQLLQRCLDRVPNTMDKRQGSIIYDALAPCCVELAQMYIELKSAYDLVFIDTSVGESLDALVRQNGLNRLQATKAIRKGEFNMVIPIGSRFSDGSNSYIVIENLINNDSKLECEQAGIIGNSYYGSLTPISYIAGITKAELTDIINLGSDIESDEELRGRYINSVISPAFGGNISDYRNRVKDLDGVGGCKVIPIWDGGGTVKLIISNSSYNVPSQDLVDEVQEIVDPTGTQEGLGMAPIGHEVSVVGAVALNITISAEFTLDIGVNPESIQDAVNSAIDDYFNSLNRDWDTVDSLIVRISQIENRMLDIDGVIDISDVELNSGTINITLNDNQLPVRSGDVVINV